MDKLSRRDAVKASAGAVAGLAAMAAMPGRLAAAQGPSLGSRDEGSRDR